MTTSILICEAPSPNSNSRWWPDLYLRKGRLLMGVTPEQASALMGARRELAMAEGNGASKVRDITLHDVGGHIIGRVSFNGRVWLSDIDGNKEIPLLGVKTAAQHELEGWDNV